MSVKEESSTHPYLSGDGQKSSALWNTNADFPASRLIEKPEPVEAVKTAPLSPPSTTATGKSTAEPGLETERLSPFSQWLMSMKRPEVHGHEAVIGVSADETMLPVTPDPEIRGKHKKKNKKKKKKKHKKGGAGDAGQGTALEGLESGIITDTLAEVAAKQGYTEEAIGMYRQLVSLHPDKAPFYLEQIRKLKEKLPES